ncbi:MAG: hypothetical protein R3A45_02440 [Bdellovibrionota bacterium]
MISKKLIRQIIDNLPEGPIIGKAPKTIREKDTSSYASVESSRGELGFFVVANGTANAHRVKIRSGSFAASMLEKIAQGVFIADLVAIIASLDLSRRRLIVDVQSST